VYAGHIAWGSPTKKDPGDRHYESAWPMDAYLPFALGLGYILSHDAIKCFASHAQIPSFPVLNNEAVMMGIMAYLCRVDPVDIPEVRSYSHDVLGYDVAAITGEVHDSRVMRCLWGAVHGKSCKLVNCGSHYAHDCGSCPQGHGAAWCNGQCAWHVEKCVPSMNDLKPTKEEYAMAASASAFSGPCPLTPPTTTSQHNGGWLYDLNLIETQHVAFDVEFGNALAQFIEEGSVIDIGAGIGQLGIFLKKTKNDRIKWYGFDGEC